MRVLLAIGEPNMSSILKGHLANNGFDVIDQEVHHRKYLEETMEYENPHIVIIHDHYLESEMDSIEKKEQEMLRIVDRWRLKNESLRVVYLCEREKNDPFLGALVARNVLDIFYQRSIPTQMFIEQLLEPPKFANVARLRIADIDLTSMDLEDKNEEAQIDGTHEEVPDTPSKKDESKTTNDAPKREKKEKEPRKSISIPKPEFHIHVHKPTKVEVERVGFVVDRQIIMVISPFERSGATFIAHQLAYQMAKQKIGVTYFENPFRRPYTYDRLGGHLQVPKYRSLYAGSLGAEDFHHTERKWSVEGVSIQALNPIYELPYEENDVPIEQFLRLFLASGDTPILLVDIGADRPRTIYHDLLEVATHILVVMDCDISNIEWFKQNEISPDFNWIYQLLQDERTIFVANRFVKAAKDVLPEQDFISIPPIDMEWIYTAQLEGTFSFQNRKALREQEQIFRELMKRVVPKSLIGSSMSQLRFKLPKIKVDK